MGTCDKCGHTYSTGAACPVCNYPNESTHVRSRLWTETKGSQDTGIEDQSGGSVELDKE